MRRLSGLIALLAAVALLSGCKVGQLPTVVAPATVAPTGVALAGTATPATVAPTTAVEPRDYALVSGQIDLMGPFPMALIDPIYVISATGLETPVPGDYAIRLLGPDDSTLAEYPFAAETAGELGGVALFLAWVPWVPGTSRVSIFSGSVELGMLPVTANAPRVTVLSPNGGETLTGPSVTVSWSAEDDDGDPLEYVVEYSADNGATWQVVASQIVDATTYTVDLSWLPGSEQALLRVMASDGVNTGSDTSDGTFSVARKRPLVSIESPASGRIIMPHDMVILRGTARDVEHGMLSDAALSWSSDLGGALGTGESLTVWSWAPGVHTITLTATDNDGITATATITMTVLTDTDNDGLPDSWEIRCGLDPNRDDRLEDPDDDSLRNLDEYALGTLPNNADSDGDTFPDGLEVSMLADPTEPAETTVNVSLQFSGEVLYCADRWYPFSKPSMAMLPGTYHFAFGNYVLDVPVAGDSVEHSVVVLELLDSNGHGLAGGTAEYYDNGWQAIPDSTDDSGVLVAPMPGLKSSVTFRMTYGGTSLEKTQDIASDSYVVFQPQGISGVTLAGPATGPVGASHTFTATVSPVAATLPITYTWRASGQAPLTHAAVPSLTDAVNLTWAITGTAPLTVTFTNTTIGDYTSQSWDFGDGKTSKKENPTYRYRTPGVYTVSLTVSGPDGTSTATKPDYITVCDSAYADFDAEPLSGVAPLSVTFTDKSCGAFSTWSWDFGDGSPAGSGANPTHTYTAGGVYTVTLAASGASGTATKTKTDFISVDNPEQAGSSVRPASGAGLLAALASGWRHLLQMGSAGLATSSRLRRVGG